ncbi:MAG: hypothetical protein KBT07_06770 [Clostridiales bacterium]|nr:hypothetical protein [Candidatus Scatonaster coprocaballi]
MTYIKFNVLSLIETADQIDHYVSEIQAFMLTTNVQTSFYLNNAWNGSDYDAFITQWDKTKDPETSTTMQMISALSRYADFLRTCAKCYGNAVINIIDKADGLR